MQKICDKSWNSFWPCMSVKVIWDKDIKQGIYIGHWTAYVGLEPLSNSPMMRYAPSLGSHFWQTLSAAVVCPSLDISTELTPDRIITELSRPALRAHLTTEDGGLVVQNCGGTCNLWILDWRLRVRSDALRTDRLGGNSWQRLYVFSDTLLKKK